MELFDDGRRGERVEITIDSRLRLRASQLGLDERGEVERVFTHKNPQYFKLKRLGFKAWKEKPKIETFRALTDGATGIETLTLPRGGLRRLRGVLAGFNREWSVTDARTEGDKKLAGWRHQLPQHRLPGGGELWEHQDAIIEAILRRENCLVRAGTGSGKTTALLAAIARIQLPTLVIVWDSGLLKQWLERIGAELGLTGDDVGIIGGGKFRIRPITMAMQQSLYRMKADRWAKVARFPGVLGADEVQRFAAKTFLDVIDRFPARYRVGMSADETRKDGKQFLIYDLFGGVEVDITRAELVARGFVHDVEVRVVPSDFRAEWYVEAKEDDEQVPDFKRLIDELSVDVERNRLVTTLARGAAAEQKQALVFCHRVDHCRRLDADMTAAGVRSGLMVGEDESAYSESVARLRAGELQAGVGTFGKIGTGLDLPAVEVGIIASPCHNNRPFYVQVSGRLSRIAKGKSGAVLYYVWDRHVHGLPALYNLRRWNRTVTVRTDDGRWIAVNDYLAELKGR